MYWNIPMGKRHISHNQRMDLLDTYDKGTVSIKEYAAAKGIGYSTFQRWLHDRKSTLNMTDDACPLNAITFKASGRLPIDKGQSHGGFESSVHFVDITSQIINMDSEDVAEDAYNKDNQECASTPPASVHTIEPISSKSKPSVRHNRLDVLLPNGIRMTFHQTSLDMSVALIKSLV